ncbi:SDR family oxidoreductase [Actinomadura parmotrematis]|uniref:NAD(P)H-binding protein n=1 Tax=Actinomadura parmotrematis TaxID=2864039 RepID=A0ABS7FYQ6_9ACTN|nr:NAD(P)H-binding protein [Actinomadura parmotrematis]MBW8484568.1 NAD(P)H-binding protein [Actinomadura parmotrematis]
MIVVTGATGNVGRRLVRALADGGEKVTAVSRGAAELPDGVRHVRADLGDAASLKGALDGADALFLLIAGEQLVSGEAPERLLEVAEGAGVRRVVLLSSQATVTRPGLVSHARLRAFEDAVRSANAEATVLRPGGFASNSFAWAESVRTRRRVEAPFGGVALPLVDPHDIADVAAAVLREDGHAGRAYTLTGPAAVTPREQVAAIAAAIGEPVAFAELTRAEARERMVAFMPAPVADGTLAIIGEPTAEERAVSPDVARVLGRPAAPFADWAARNAAAFA